MGEDAVGDIVTGSMFARAVEPRAGESHRHGAAHPELCLNCGTRLIGAHCHACGQGGHVHRSMGAILHDIGHGVFHFEGKAWATLPMLAFRPGELTRRYVGGERVRFVSPMALFLFSVFLMFTVVANLPGWDLSGGDFFKPGGGGITAARAKMAETAKSIDEDVVRLSARVAKERAEPSADPTALSRLERRLAEARQSRVALATAQAAIAPTSGETPSSEPTVRITSKTGAGDWLGQKWLHAKENPKLMLYKMKTSAYKFSWALIPLSLPFLWLLFPFSRRFGLYDHAVFATYSLTFMSLLVVVLAVLGALGVPSALLIVAGTLIPPFHIYKQLKGAYSLRRWSALLRTAVLSFAIMGLIVPLFSVLLLYLGVAD